jgi:hypothetical protein
MRLPRVTGMALALLVGIVVSIAPGVAQAADKQGAGCVGRHPAYIEGVFEPSYSAGCSGHDEPELNPLSNLAGSAKDVTWSFDLPGNGGRFPVDAVGPTFWFGGPVTDPDSLFGQAFEELQFYPNSVVTNCTPSGGFVVSQQPGDYTVCSPVWSLTTTGQKPNYHEPAAFNAMLTRDGTNAPLVMHAKDRIDVHYFVTAAKDGWHIRITDRTTGESGLIVLNSKKSGPLMPPFSRSKIGNSLGWGSVHDAPIAFVWEIGHTSPFESPGSAFCWPGAAGCYSYDAPAWANPEPAHPHHQRHLRRRLTPELLGRRQRLRRKGRDHRPHRNRFDLQRLWRPLLHLSVVHQERRRVVQLRGGLSDHRQSLRQGRPVCPDA